MVSIFAAGVIVGRIASGLALDRFATRWVAALSLRALQHCRRDECFRARGKFLSRS